MLTAILANFQTLSGSILFVAPTFLPSHAALTHCLLHFLFALAIAWADIEDVSGPLGFGRPSTRFKYRSRAIFSNTSTGHYTR